MPQAGGGNGKRIAAPKMPSYVKLDMALGVGAGSTLFDKSRYRAHGAITGASWAAGLHGKALDFDKAIPSYVEIPAAHTQLNFTSEKFSLIIRVRFANLDARSWLLSRGKLIEDGYRWWAYANGRVDLDTNDGTFSKVSLLAIGSVTTATWYTLGVSRDGATVTMYLDGVDATHEHGTHTNPATCARAALIGVKEGKTDNPLDGKIEFLRIFGGIALSDSEHLAWHNALA